MKKFISDEYLSLDNVCIGHPLAKAELDCVRKQASQRGARLQILREFMQEADWLRFCQDHPGAITWFDSDGVPVPCK